MRCFRLILIAAALWLPAAAATAAPTPPVAASVADTVLTSPESAPPWRLRGTAAPLVREPSATRRILRTAALVPYSALWLAIRPPIALIEWDEEHGYSRTVMSWFTRDVEVVNTTVAAFLGYETGFGVTVLGLRIHSTDWFGTGLDNRFRFSYLNSSKNIVETKLAGRLAGDATFNFRTRFQRTPGRDFFGFGRVLDAESYDYDYQLFLNELQVRRPVAPHLDAALLVYSRTTRLREHDDDSLLAASPELWALSAANRYVGLEAELRRDTRDRGEMATHGTLARLAAGWNLSRRSDDSDYRHLTAELQAHRPLFRDRILAARLFYEGVDADDGARLPFTEMRSLGGRRDLRGYERGRFLDRHLLAASLEYRYPVTKLFQGRLFGDWGTVAPTLGDLDLGHLAWSYGLGLALVLDDDDLFIVQAAFGEEGGHVYIGTATPFGYESRRKR